MDEITLAPNAGYSTLERNLDFRLVAGDQLRSRVRNFVERARPGVTWSIAAAPLTTDRSGFPEAARGA